MLGVPRPKMTERGQAAVERCLLWLNAHRDEEAGRLNAAADKYERCAKMHAAAGLLGNEAHFIAHAISLRAIAKTRRAA